MKPSRVVEARPIFLVGFMATGKSTVGRLLAARLERRFVDLDETIVEEAHATVPELFQSEGERGFRVREARALERVAQGGPQVVAVGGGAPCHGGNMDLMLAAGQVVCLTASPAELLARVGDPASRPLLGGAPDLAGEIARLLEERQSAYTRAHLTIDTSGVAPSQIARTIAEELGACR